MKDRQKRQILYPVLLSTRVDREIRDELDYIALFDHTKVGTWLRELVVDAVKRYQRNTQYKKFKKSLEAKEKK